MIKTIEITRHYCGIALVLLLALSACTPPADQAVQQTAAVVGDDCCEGEQAQEASMEVSPVKAIKAELGEGAELQSGIAVPKAVRDNLGITFIEVEKRAIRSTRRVPGIFELRPEARREFRAPLRGRITLAVKQFQNVKSGDLLFSINSPQWRLIQHDAVEAEGEIVMAEANRDVLVARLEEAKALLAKSTERMKNLEAAGTRNATLEAETTALRSSIPRIWAELEAQEAAVEEAHGHFFSRLKILSSITGLSIEDLRKDEREEPVWRSIRDLEVYATGDGTVEALSVNDGAWLDEGELALTTVDKHAIRFHAEAPQSDIGVYKEGQLAQVVPAQGTSVNLQSMASGRLQLGLVAHTRERTISLYVEPEETPPDWARAGVSAFLEISLTEDDKAYWAIPKSAVIQDGLEQVIYRRNPDAPDRVLRMVADLGEDDGRWVALKSGVKAGDEVVLEGAYALKITGEGNQAPEGYHYHADGTLHKNH